MLPLGHITKKFICQYGIDVKQQYKLLVYFTVPENLVYSSQTFQIIHTNIGILSKYQQHVTWMLRFHER